MGVLITRLRTVRAYHEPSRGRGGRTGAFYTLWVFDEPTKAKCLYFVLNRITVERKHVKRHDMFRSTCMCFACAEALYLVFHQSQTIVSRRAVRVTWQINILKRAQASGSPVCRATQSSTVGIQFLSWCSVVRTSEHAKDHEPSSHTSASPARTTGSLVRLLEI